MEHEHNRSGNTIINATPHGHDSYGGFGANTLLGMLAFYGLIDKNRNVTDKVATEAQLQAIGTNLHMSVEAVKAGIQALQIATCDQTHAITGTIHASSTANLVGQNMIGEKISDTKYAGAMNAKDAEKTTLIDGSLTRKNDDDNTNEVKNLQTVSFAGIEKSICETNHNIATGFAKLSSQNSEGTCKILGEIKDSKYEGLLVAERNHNATMNGLKDLGFQNANIAKEAIIREKDDQLRESTERINTMQHNEIKEEIEELKRCKTKEAENNLLSKNIVTSIGNSIEVDFSRRLDSVTRAVELLSHNISIMVNNTNIGRNNSN